MQATIVKTQQKIQLEIISDPKQITAAENGELLVGKKPVLITKGADTMAVCCQIYTRFSKELDSQGQAFVFSRKHRSLAHSDPVWRSRSKVTGPQFEQYLSNYFQFSEKVSNVNGEALLLVDKPGKFFSALAMQPRFTAKFVDLFEIVD